MHMLYDSIGGLMARLDELLGPDKQAGARTHPTVFILLPDMRAWSAVMPALRRACRCEARLSRLCAGERLPLPTQIYAQISACRRTTLLAPLGELLRVHAYPGRDRLLQKLARMKRAGGPLLVPLLACAQEFHALLGETGSACRVLELIGDEQPCRVRFCAPGLAGEYGATLAEWLAALEGDEPPREVCVSVRAPMRFAGRGARVIASGYALMSAHLSALEFAADERALSDERWRALDAALSGLIPAQRGSARAAFEECARRESAGLIGPGDPLRAGAWLHRLAGLHAGAYMRRVLSAEASYSSLEEAAALEILSAFNPARGDSPAFSPERMSAGEWLDVRAERGEMLRALGMSRLPDAYWRLLERAPHRRLMLYSSLCTDDERAFCRRYLLDEYHFSRAQLEGRADVRRLYPELLADAGNGLAQAVPG